MYNLRMDIYLFSLVFSPPSLIMNCYGVQPNVGFTISPINSRSFFPQAFDELWSPSEEPKNNIFPFEVEGCLRYSNLSFLAFFGEGIFHDSIMIVSPNQDVYYLIS